MTAELVLLGTAGAPMPVAGRGGISSALIVDGRVFVIDCGRGSPSAFVDAGLDFRRLEAVFITHLHVDHTGDLPGMLLYPWGIRADEHGPLAPIRVYGPSRPGGLPAGDAAFHRETVVNPDLPDPGTADLVEHILAGYAYHLNVMPLDAHMPDAGALVRATDIPTPKSDGATRLLREGSVCCSLACAQPGLSQCAREDSNLHGPYSPQGPQPCASTNSATGAWGGQYSPGHGPSPFVDGDHLSGCGSRR